MTLPEKFGRLTEPVIHAHMFHVGPGQALPVAHILFVGMAEYGLVRLGHALLDHVRPNRAAAIAVLPKDEAVAP